MQTRSIVSLVPTVLLCLPSLAGAIVVVVNSLLQRQVGKWGVVSSSLAASAVFIGWPLVLVAAVIGGLTGLSRRVSPRVKYANYIIVGLAAVANFWLTRHFGM